MVDTPRDWLDFCEPGPTAADALLRAQRCEEEASDMMREARMEDERGRHRLAERLRHLASQMRGQAPMWRAVAQHRAEEEAA